MRIESLEDYKKAKAELKDKQWRKDNLHGSAEFTWHMNQHIQLLEAVLLQYRRQHNEYEAGDKIIFAAMGNKVMEYADCLEMFLSQGLIRHATDAEIQAGKRLEVCCG